MGGGAVLGLAGSMWAADKSAKAQERAAEEGSRAALEQTRMGIEAQKEMQQTALNYQDKLLNSTYQVQNPFYTQGVQASADLHYIITGRQPTEETLREMTGLGDIDRQLEFLKTRTFEDDETEAKRINSEKISRLERERVSAQNRYNEGYKLPDYKESEAYKWQKEQGEDQTLAYINKMGFNGSRMEANTMRDFYSNLNAQEEQMRIQRLSAEAQGGMHAADIMSGSNQAAAQGAITMTSYGQQSSAQLYGQSANAAMQGAAAEGASQAGLYNSYSNLFAGMFNNSMNSRAVPELPYYKDYQSDFRVNI